MKVKVKMHYGVAYSSSDRLGQTLTLPRCVGSTYNNYLVTKDWKKVTCLHCLKMKGQNE